MAFSWDSQSKSWGFMAFFFVVFFPHFSNSTPWRRIWCRPVTCWEWGQSTPGWWAPSTPGDNSRDSSQNSWDFLPKFPGISSLNSLGFLPWVFWDFLPDFLPEFLGISCLNSWVFSPAFPVISSLISSLISSPSSLGLPPRFPWDSLPEFPGISSSFIPWDFLLELPRNFPIRSLNPFSPLLLEVEKGRFLVFPGGFFFLWIE